MHSAFLESPPPLLPSPFPEMHAGVKGKGDDPNYYVEFRNVSVSVAVAPFQPMGNFSMPDMRVAASGGLLLGGEENGLYVEIGGTLDTATRSGSVWKAFSSTSRHFW